MAIRKRCGTTEAWKGPEGVENTVHGMIQYRHPPSDPIQKVTLAYGEHQVASASFRIDKQRKSQMPRYSFWSSD